MHARYYKPLIGRFLSPDALEGGASEPQTWNRYTYVLDSPINYADPHGLWGAAFFDQMGAWVIYASGQAYQLETTVRGFNPNTAVPGLSGLADSLMVDNITREEFARESLVRAGQLSETPVVAAGMMSALHLGVGVAASATTSVLGTLEGDLTALELSEPVAVPETLAEQIALEEAESGLGERIMQGKINDPRYPGWKWAKMQHVHTNPDGTRIVVHYWRNLWTGLTKGFKFK